jgi:NAD(P)-dependent dehydrogenase (short-subunit alcohol dehydrogenase family)
VATLAGKVVIVTGAGRGIGREEAVELVAQGASVVANDLDDPAVEAVAAELGDAALAVSGDCAEAGTAERLVAAAVERFGRLDALVNNAGLLRDRTLAKMSETEWDDVVRVNLRGHFACTAAAFRHWRAEDRPGRVICTSSTSGILGGFGQSNYGAAKAGVAAFAQIAAQEGRAHGITVNAVCPAARTRLSEAAFGEIPGADDAFDFWDPANVAPFVAFLCSDAAAGISGKVFGVQGDTVELYRPWTSASVIANDGRRWTLAGLDERVKELFDTAEIAPGAEDGMARLRYSMRSDAQPTRGGDSATRSAG